MTRLRILRDWIESQSELVDAVILQSTCNVLLRARAYAEKHTPEMIAEAEVSDTTQICQKLRTRDNGSTVSRWRGIKERHKHLEVHR
jgi:hypothetical protein